MRISLTLLGILVALLKLQRVTSHGVQPLSTIGIGSAVIALDDRAYIRATPLILGLNRQNKEWITLEYGINNPSIDDWIGVFSPANFRHLALDLKEISKLNCLYA